MNLCIDQGNTRIKIAVFENDLLKKTATIVSLLDEELTTVFHEFEIDNIILSSVRNTSTEQIAYFKEKADVFILLDHTTSLPIENKYETPELLGKDRLAAIVGANALNPQKDILVIDAGTAITYDFINRNAEYLGGTIAPGLKMRFRALNEFTEKLPLITIEENVSFLGLNTTDAIYSGVVNGMLFEIEGYISKLRKQYPELLVFLTGGDCFFFEDKLKNSIFANENLVLIGLNRIINYNVQK